MTAFVKMQGLGNDFVVIDRRGAGAPVSPEEAIAMCDRHRGIGADGVLSIVPSHLAPLGMHITNPDGSIAEMCGNGLRCVARYAVDRGLLPSDGGPIETGRGVLSCFIEADGQVRVDMGAPVLSPSLIPVTLTGDRAVRFQLEAAGTVLEATAVSMGNPHVVCFVEGPRTLDRWAQEIGPAVERHPLFPRRTNAEFARVVEPGFIEVVVWERGAGLTQACGTGACATAVAAILTGRARENVPLRVLLPGGELRILVEPGLARVWMTGPAVQVFAGEIERV